MSNRRWRLWLGLGLAAIAGVLFLVHYLIFRDSHHLGIFTLHDLAFLPVEVLLVTLILHALLEHRRHNELIQKLNMVIGAFFSEVGIDLLKRLAMLDTNRDRLERSFKLDGNWDDKRLKQASGEASSGGFDLKPTRESIREMRGFMSDKRSFILGLLENQNVLENERFTDVLWAVFHLGDELTRRIHIDALPDSDVAHIAVDMERAYGRMICEWFEHLRHLKVRYPYLYSLSVRSNPLDEEVRVEVIS